MSLDGRYRVVLDEIDDWSAVLLVENERGDEVIDDYRVDRDDLPTGVEEGAVLMASFEDGEVRHLVFEPAETERRRSAAAERFDRLAERPPGAEENDDGADQPVEDSGSSGEE